MTKVLPLPTVMSPEELRSYLATNSSAKPKAKVVKKKKETPSSITAEQYRAENVDQDEHDLQSRCVSWFRRVFPQLMIQSTPNAGKRSYNVARRLKREGMVTGWPDLFVVYPSNGYHGLYLEMKTVNGTPSPDQLLVHAYLRSVGYEVAIPKTFEEFQKAVNEYLL